MRIKHAIHPEDVKRYTTEELRDKFLLAGLFAPGAVEMAYSHVDRMIAGAATPLERPLPLTVDSSMGGVAYFLERREIGIINVGGGGRIVADGTAYTMEHTDGLYIGKGVRNVLFESVDAGRPAKFYFNSAPAHAVYPTVKIERSSIEPRHLGSIENSNERNIYQYIVPGRVDSCQLVMGMTALEPGNMWNSMPCHTHERRAEIYMYFNLPEEHIVMHYMGEPAQTRHIVMKNEDVVLSPSWSIHAGVGTHNYAFVWGMAGENQVFDDMDGVKVTDLR